MIRQDLKVFGTIGFLLGSYALAIGLAYAHSWYESGCCSNNDCYPVEMHEVEEIDEGQFTWRYVTHNVKFTKAQVKVSQDKKFHVCIAESKTNDKVNYTGRCIYILTGS